MSKEFNKKIGAVLREKRKEKGFSQEYIADRLGVSKNQVSHWELGHRSIYAEQLSDYCEILGVTMQSIFDDMEK